MSVAGMYGDLFVVRTLVRLRGAEAPTTNLLVQ
jgi:hypothetical protein